MLTRNGQGIVAAPEGVPRHRWRGMERVRRGTAESLFFCEAKNGHNSLSAREYNDSRKWRAIADANNIDDPENLEAGTIVELPPLY